MARGKHANMPSAVEINDYWETRDLPMAPTRQEDGDCFACGYPWDGMWGVDRAHIDPDAGEGPENLHLLCKGCHQQSEHLTGDDYRRWYNFRVAMSEFERFSTCPAVVVDAALRNPQRPPDMSDSDALDVARQLALRLAAQAHGAIDRALSELSEALTTTDTEQAA